MLEEYKQLYEENASLIAGWKKMSIPELANKYVDAPNIIEKEAYLSAIICKYWKYINNHFYKQDIKIASVEDCYDWVLDGICQALEEAAWRDERSTIFNDPKGPEKAIVKCILCTRANFYQYANYDKRKLNYTSYSLDALEEASSDGYYIPYFDEVDSLHEYLSVLVNKYFEVKDYFISFFIDALFNSELTAEDRVEEKSFISISKFNRYVQNFTSETALSFSSLYNIDVDKVNRAFEYIKNMPSYRVHANVNRTINILKKDDILKDFLLGD